MSKKKGAKGRNLGACARKRPTLRDCDMKQWSHERHSIFGARDKKLLGLDEGQG